ncbi:hypothetical protein [Sporofaciens sp. SGI.106]|uniref:hypothetical protein n=1 Tax=Sporofaciens sp. SGI.106 TaxID=3420568 RepID=UPI003D058A1E
MMGFYKKFRAWAVGVTMIAAALALSAATYAWFTSNRLVNTDKATARSGTDTLELQISSEGGNNFQASSEAAIIQMNRTALSELMPVSTADLNSFVYNPSSRGDMAESFRTVTDENYYYHGRIYLRALAQGDSVSGRMALYLDEDNEAGGALAQSDGGLVLNAARLGLTFDGGNPAIFYLSNTSNPEEQQIRNTSINGEILADGQVLKSSGGTLSAVADPSIPLADRTIIMNDSGAVLPAAPLLYMNLNQIYTVDIYFYIEGCDPDCSNSIGLDELDLHLAFYGILEE